MADFQVTIGIQDDAINEAEQVFVVQLQLVNSINRNSIDISDQPSSLCRIIDNDRKQKHKLSLLIRLSILLL